MKENLISVIIPVYNTALFLEECLNSVLAQTYRNFEIILVDDGSTDGSGDICDRFASLDSRIRLFHCENHGVSAARNFGLAHSDGEFISFVDSDDSIKPEMFETMLNEIKKSKTDLVICRAKAVSEKGDFLRESPLFSTDKTVFGSEEMLKNLVLSPKLSYVVPWNKLYRRKCFNGIHYPDGRTQEDECVIHRIFGNCDTVSCINDIFYNYRIRSNSIMNKKASVKRLDGIYAYLDRVDFFVARNELMPAQKSLYAAVCRLTDLCIQISESTEKERAYFSAEIIRRKNAIGLSFLSVKEKIKLKAFVLSPSLYYKFYRIVSGK